MSNKIFVKSLIFFPLILILINFYNLFFPNDYRNDPYLINGYFSEENQKILNYASNKKRNEILSYKDAIKKIDKLYSRHGETLRFLTEASKVYFVAKVPKKYSWKEKYAKIKFEENWILYFVRKFEEIKIYFGLSSKYNEAYTFYQSSDYRFALKRGISICSQDAISFANLLKKRFNIDYNIIGMGGHVVMEAKIMDKYYISDPNMGLTFGFSIEEYYSNFKNQLKIKKAYTDIGRSDLTNYFDKEGNRKFSYTGPKAKYNAYNPDTLTLYSDYIKWLLPLFFLILGIYLNYKKKFVK